MEDTRLYMIASDVSIPAQEPSDIYQLIDMRMCSTRPNGNRQGVTEAFIDHVVGHPEKYTCLPLYVDIDRLRGRDYMNLGHMFNEHTKTFGTTMVGSMCSFRKAYDEYGVSLMAQARVPRRESDICRGVMDLYAMNMLNFSYEISYVQSDVVVKDGVTYVDASENNNITGMAIVSVPAYRESTAQSLIAEDQHIKDDTREIHEDEDDHDEVHDPETDDDDDNEGADHMTLEEAMSAIAEKDARIAELEGNLTAEKQNTENIENEKKAKEDELAQAACEKDEMKAELENAQNAIAQKDQKIAELETQVAELTPMKAELEAIKAEKEAQILAEKQSKAKSFAERQGLDVETDEVKNAIASLNYEAIASMAMEIKPEAENKVTLASFTMSKGMEIEDKYGDLLKTR